MLGVGMRTERAMNVKCVCSELIILLVTDPCCEWLQSRLSQRRYHSEVFSAVMCLVN